MALKCLNALITIDMFQLLKLIFAGIDEYPRQKFKF